MLEKLEQVAIKTSSITDANTAATHIQAKLCQGTRCCTMKNLGPFTKGATTNLYGDNLNDCQNHSLLQDSADAVTVTFTTTNTDGWRGEYIRLSFTRDTYQCPIQDWLDYPSDPSYVATCGILYTG